MGKKRIVKTGDTAESETKTSQVSAVSKKKVGRLSIIRSHIAYIIKV